MYIYFSMERNGGILYNMSVSFKSHRNSQCSLVLSMNGNCVGFFSNNEVILRGRLFRGRGGIGCCYRRGVAAGRRISNIVGDVALTKALLTVIYQARRETYVRISVAEVGPNVIIILNMPRRIMLSLLDHKVRNAVI